MNHRTSHRLRAVLAAAALVTSVTVGSVATGALGAGPAGAAGAPLVVGDICSCTGPLASSVAQTTPTRQARAKYNNSHGGGAGHQVQLIVRDDGYNPGTAQSLVQQLVQDDHVVALFDNSDVDNAFAGYVQQRQIPVIGGQTSAIAAQYPMFFVPGATYNYFPGAVAALAKALGVKKLADLYCVEAAACLQSSVGLKTALSQVGLQLSYTTSISFGSPNFTAPCLASQQSGADAMVVGDATVIVNKVVGDCNSQGYKPRQLSGDGTVAISWLSIPGMNNNADVQENIPFFVHNPATDAMFSSLNKYAPGVTTSPNYGEIVVENWADGALLAAVGQTGKIGTQPTAAQVVAGLYALPSGTTLGGLAPPLHYVRGKPSSNPCHFWMGIKNGKWITLNGGKVNCSAKLVP